MVRALFNHGKWDSAERWVDLFKQIKSISLIIAVLLAFSFIYQSSLRRIANAGNEWLRRHGSEFCEPGYHLHSEHVWEDLDGQIYFVYIFQSTPMHRGIDRGIQILLENAEHNELQRFNVPSEHRILNTAMLNSFQSKRLEIVFLVEGPKSDLYCYHWTLEKGWLVRADFVA